MKKSLAAVCITAAVISMWSCTKAPVIENNLLAKRYFDAWVKANHPEAGTTALGTRILSDIPGNGELIGDPEKTPFVYCTYRSTDLEGNISKTTSEQDAKQLGTYDETSYYGPRIVYRGSNYLDAGVSDMMETMRVGGTRTAAIPGWLMSKKSYKSADDYYKNESGSNAIYTFTIEEAISDIVKWEIDSLDSFMKHQYPGVDSTSYGYYYIKLEEPLDTTEFDKGKSVYINYTGRLLNGKVFDSTILDTCKDNHLYVAGKTYSPTELKWYDEDDEKITFSGGGSMINGFEKCISGMKAGERGICIFYSTLGYGIDGSGEKIPAFSPLMFEIQMLGLNKDGSIDEKEDKTD